MPSFTQRLKEGLERSRKAISEIFYFGAAVDDDFWEDLEDRLVMGDVGADVAGKIVDDLRLLAAQNNYKDASAIRGALIDKLASYVYTSDVDPFATYPACVLFVGINGAGKTTTVGKLAYAACAEKKRCIIGAADTFRAAAIEQLEVWATRAQVPCVTRERGSDPASVCFDTLVQAQQTNADVVLIDTAGRLHTSKDLMQELLKVVTITKKHANMPVYVVLVLDASCGQNGLVQAREFNEALGLDGMIVTKLDGTSKGGIAIRASHELQLPIFRIGVGETLEDLQPFSAHDFACALVGSE
jgi:hypothetical protein